MVARQLPFFISLCPKSRMEVKRERKRAGWRKKEKGKKEEEEKKERGRGRGRSQRGQRINKRREALGTKTRS